MSKILILYKSQYGHTKQYAQWIAQEMKADLYENSKISVKELMDYDTIIYGGGIYAGGIAGISIITKNFEKFLKKQIIVFTVGLASTDRKEVFIPIIEKSFSQEMRHHINFFHFRGGIDYKKLGIVHKAMMAMMKFILSRKKPNELLDDDKEVLATYGKKVDFTNKDSIIPLLSLLKETQSFKNQ